MSKQPHISRLARSFLPSTAVLEMTYRCNNACIFCSCPWERDGGKFELKYESNPDEWRSCIALLVHLGVTRLAFTGGEPLRKITSDCMLRPHRAQYSITCNALQ